MSMVIIKTLYRLHACSYAKKTKKEYLPLFWSNTKYHCIFPQFSQMLLPTFCLVDQP